MGHWYNPPPPFVGGSQPHAPHEVNPSFEAVAVNNPPFSHRNRTAAIMAAVVAAAQPDPWTYAYSGGAQPYDNRNVNAVFEAIRVDNPIPAHEGRVPEVIQRLSWRDFVWDYDYHSGAQPYGHRALNAVFENVATISPPPVISDAAEYANVLPSWQPDPWQWWVYERPKLTAVARSVDNPPVSSDAAEYAYLLPPWQIDPWQWYQYEVKRPLTAVGRSVDNPPPSSAATGYAYLLPRWTPPDPAPTLAGKAPPPTPAVVNNPIPSSDALEYSITLPLWQPPDPSPFIGGSQPLDSRNLNAAFEAVVPPVVNNPPTVSLAAAYSAAWQPTWYAGQETEFVLTIAAGQVSKTSKQTAYVSDPDPLPTLTVRYAPVNVDQLIRPNPPLPAAHWTVADAVRQRQVVSPPPSYAPLVRAPNALSDVFWRPQDPAPLRTRPRFWEVVSPPPPYRIPVVWYAERVNPEQRRPQVRVSVDPPQPYRRRLDLATAWLPGPPLAPEHYLSPSLVQASFAIVYRVHLVGDVLAVPGVAGEALLQPGGAGDVLIVPPAVDDFS